MITPAAIQSKQFTKGVNGYKKDEVDNFLDIITLDLDKLIQENRELRERIAELNVDIDRFRGSEGTLFETLESAKALMSDISISAENRAEVILKNAELEAERIQREAKESVERITEEAVEMAHRWDQFKKRYKNLLLNEMERFENLNADLLIETNENQESFYSDFEASVANRVKSETAQPVRANRPNRTSNIEETIQKQNR